MWKSIELPIDVTGSVPLPGPLDIAASVFLPNPDKLTIPPTVIFALPGKGYTRGHFDIEAVGHQGYSEAEHHTGRGIIFVSADHPGVGASSIPDLKVFTAKIAWRHRASALRRRKHELLS